MPARENPAGTWTRLSYELPQAGVGRAAASGIAGACRSPPSRLSLPLMGRTERIRSPRVGLRASMPTNMCDWLPARVPTGAWPIRQRVPGPAGTPPAPQAFVEGNDVARVRPPVGGGGLEFVPASSATPLRIDRDLPDPDIAHRCQGILPQSDRGDAARPPRGMPPEERRRRPARFRGIIVGTGVDPPPKDP